MQSSTLSCTLAWSTHHWRHWQSTKGPLPAALAPIRRDKTRQDRTRKVRLRCHYFTLECKTNKTKSQRQSEADHLASDQTVIPKTVLAHTTLRQSYCSSPMSYLCTAPTVGLSHFGTTDRCLALCCAHGGVDDSRPASMWDRCSPLCLTVLRCASLCATVEPL